jgi:hypothetical protein
VQQLHARVDDRSHVEMTDTDEEVVVQPHVDLRSQSVHVDGRRRRGDLDDDVDEAVDVVGSRGRSPGSSSWRLRIEEMRPTSPKSRDRMCVHRVSGGSRLGIGVIERIPEDHF